MNSPDAYCSSCSAPMAKLRTEWSAIAQLHRFECVRCDAVGTVEIRTEQSVAADSPKSVYHGASQEQR